MKTDYNVLDEQNKEAERLGMKLDPLEDEENSKPEVEKENLDEKPKEKIEKDDSESDDKKLEEDKSQDDKEDKNQPKRPPKGSLQQEAFKQRENKRLQGIVSEQLTVALTPITKMLEELKNARTAEDKTEVVENIDDELAKIAESEKIPVDQFKKIAGLITKQVQSTLAPQLKKIDSIDPVLERQRQEDNQRQVAEIFKSEWETTAEPLLIEQYPKATAKQTTEAKKLLSELAVSEKYGDTRGNKDGVPEHPAYPVDYIIFKEAERFDALLKSPKKSFESSGNITDDSDTEPKSLEELSGKEVTSTEEAIKLSKALDKSYGKEKVVIMRNGEAVDVSE